MVNPMAIAELIDATAGAVSNVAGASINPFNLTTRSDAEVGDGLLRRARDAQRAACDLWAGNPFALTGSNSGATEYMNEACKDYLGDKGTPLPNPIPGQDFEGGQCPGVLYDVAFTARWFRNGSLFNTYPAVSSFTGVAIGNQFGALSQFLRNVTNNPPGSTYPQTVNYSIRFNGAQAFFSLGGAPNRQIGTNSFGVTDDWQLEIDSIYRRDGQPDLCGNPSPFPGSPISFPQPINIPPTKWLPPGGSIKQPYTTPDGKLVIPVTIAPEFDIDIGIGGSREGYSPPRPGQIDPDIENPSESPEEVNTEPLYGVQIDSILTPPSRSVIVGTDPEVSAVILGNFSWLVKTDSGTYWTAPFPIKSYSGLLVHNLEADVIGYRLRGRVGYTWVVTKILRQD